MNIQGGSVVQFRKFSHPILEPISEHKTRVTKTVNLYSYLTSCDNIMYTSGPNDNCWLTEVTRMDTNRCDIPNDSNFALVWSIGDTVGSHGENEELKMFYV